MTDALTLRDAPEEVVVMLEAAAAELAAKGYYIGTADLLKIRQRQATGQIWSDDPPITMAESPERTVMVRQADGNFEDMTFAREQTPGLSPLDSAVRKMRSAAYAYNEEDYTACAIMAREAFTEVVNALKDKTYMDTEVERVPMIPKGQSGE